MSNNSKSSGGIGFCGLLTVAFIVLKLCSVIGWSWWWILAPIWLPVTVVFVVALICFIVGAWRRM